MKTRYLISLWVVFFLTTLLSRAVYATYWLDELNQLVLLVLAATSLALGVAILIEKRFSFYSKGSRGVGSCSTSPPPA